MLRCCTRSYLDIGDTDVAGGLKEGTTSKRGENKKVSQLLGLGNCTLQSMMGSLPRLMSTSGGRTRTNSIHTKSAARGERSDSVRMAACIPILRLACEMQEGMQHQQTAKTPTEQHLDLHSLHMLVPLCSLRPGNVCCEAVKVEQACWSSPLLDLTAGQVVYCHQRQYLVMAVWLS